MSDLTMEHERIMEIFNAAYAKNKILIKSTKKQIKIKRRIIRENEMKFKVNFILK